MRSTISKINLNPHQWTSTCLRRPLNILLKTIGTPFSDLSPISTPAPAGWEVLPLPSDPLQQENLSLSPSLHHHLDQGVPLPPYPSPPLSLSPQMVSQMKKSYKKRTDQGCHPQNKAQQVKMSLKLSISGLQDKHGLFLVQEVMEQIMGEMQEGLSHDFLGHRACQLDTGTGVYTYCLQSIYSPHHFAHHCIDLSCACMVNPLA